MEQEKKLSQQSQNIFNIEYCSLLLQNSPVPILYDTQQKKQTEPLITEKQLQLQIKELVNELIEECCLQLQKQMSYQMTNKINYSLEPKYLLKMKEQEQEITVKCQHCEDKFAQFYIEVHLEECQKRIIQCPLCKISMCFDQHDQHMNHCQQFQEKCSLCSKTFKRKDASIHYRLKCQYSNQISPRRIRQIQKEQEYDYIPITQNTKKMCKWCSQVQQGELKLHQQFCQANFQIKQLIQNNSVLTERVKHSILQMYNRSTEQHKQKIDTMKNIIFSFGYTQGDLLLMSQFIEFQAPIIIHFRFNQCMPGFIKDSHYRNIFERSHNSQQKSSRIQWEKYLFGNLYDEVQGYQRIKYGVMNIVNDRKGNFSCQTYGQSYLVLKKHMRVRCTLAHNRKYKNRETVCTLKYNYPVLSRFSVQEIKALFLSSQGYKLNSQQLRKFKQVHIHGPINFETDIEKVCVPQKILKQNRSLANKFTQRYNILVQSIQNGI